MTQRNNFQARKTKTILSRFELGMLYFFVFATGGAGLIYEVTWQKYLSRIMGSDTMATAVIMGVFLGGLSLGYYLCGKLSTRVTNHLKAYALLEAIIAVWCMSFPYIFSAFYSLTESWSFEPPIYMIVEGVISSFILIGIPTICMGATVPMLTRGISTTLNESTSVHARIYGVNTFGAFLGTLVAGFWLIPFWGLPLTMLGTAVLNFAAAAFFYFISHVPAFQPVEASTSKTTSSAKVADLPSSSISRPRLSQKRVLLYIIAFLSGFYVMTMENVLFRIANLSFGSSSYSFSMVLSVFLVGIAIGSFVVSRLRRIPSNLLFFNQLGLAVLLMGLYLTLDYWPYWAHLIRILFQSNVAGFYAYYFCGFVVLLLILIPALVFAGATLPIAFHELKEDLENVGRHSGLLLSWNTMGNLLGSLLGGIVLYYFFNCQEVFLIAVILSAVSALLASWRAPFALRITSLGMILIAFVLFAVTPFFNMKHFAVGTFRIRKASNTSFEGADSFFSEFFSTNHVLSQKDGPACSVAVIETKYQGNQRWPSSQAIVVNGKSDSNTVEDIYTLRLSAHIPSLLARERRNAFIVGLGTGVTAGQLALYPEYERIHVAEISPGVVDALPYFEKATGGVHKDPRLSIYKGDAFRVLSRSEDKWDVVVSEPSNPWVTGVDMLYTSEFYKLVKNHLAPGGVFLQWIHIYSASREMVGMVANTLDQEFEEVSAFYGANEDILFVARNESVTEGDLMRAERVLNENQAARAALSELDIDSFDALLLRQIWSPSVIKGKFWNYGIQTLDNPVLHYIAGKDFFMGKFAPASTVFSYSSSSYSEEYLLVRKYSDWISKDLTVEEVKSFTRSAKGHLQESSPLPIRPLIKLKAHLANPERHPLSSTEEKAFSVPLIRLIGELADNEEVWNRFGLKGAPMRLKAEMMLRHLKKLRRWIAPYPIDGLKKLLRLGIKNTTKPRERNWFVLQLARLVLMEGASKSVINEVFSFAIRGEEGKIIIAEHDMKLFENVELMMARIR
ncbi:MAG: hypothetical protein GY847_41425 [Proteobacteria bacterium]|nr:hypothetical protein [Pseudomonadota bacterium]